MTDKSRFLLESIKVDKNQIHNLDYHEERITKSSVDVFGQKIIVNFDPIIDEVRRLPDLLFKLRVVYNGNYFKYSFNPYKKKKINTLKKVYSSKVTYSYKYLDRDKLDSLYLQRRHHDDIIIIRDNLVTDSYYCNLAFRKDDKWYTPATPLLKGTKRQQLIENGEIEEKIISATNLGDYDSVSLFNAMLDHKEIIIPIDNVF